MSDVDNAMRKKLGVVRQALEEHLAAINENTTEIQALFDYLHDLDVKFDKISQRLDHFELQQEPAKPSVAPLERLEKKVFLVLYTEESPLSFQEIAGKAQLPVALISESISSLTSKGVPLVRSFFNDQQFVKLDPQFKEIQAKENVVNLSLQSFME
ncbi:hypothetical protein J4228_04335 [Candidatus Woesearchaeota archaeon]|nr:hypothetical protein [Candidatus Woesearchaeota archaeon]